MTNTRNKICSLCLTILTIVGGISCHVFAGSTLPGQIIIDPERPDKLVYNRDADQDGRLDPAFLCGLGV